MMVPVVLLASLFLVGAGLWGVTSPAEVRRFGSQRQSRDFITLAGLFLEGLIRDFLKAHGA